MTAAWDTKLRLQRGNQDLTAARDTLLRRGKFIDGNINVLIVLSSCLLSSFDPLLLHYGSL